MSVNNNKSIRIANGQGFRGDSLSAPIDLINNTLEDVFNNLSEEDMTVLENGNQITLDIEIPILLEDDLDDTWSDDEELKCFLSCKEINERLGKSEKVKKDDKLILDNIKCSICTMGYVSGELKRKLPKCNHYYHKRCIDTWLKIQGTCPICRYDYINEKKLII